MLLLCVHVNSSCASNTHLHQLLGEAIACSVMHTLLALNMRVHIAMALNAGQHVHVSDGGCRASGSAVILLLC